MDQTHTQGLYWPLCCCSLAAEGSRTCTDPAPRLGPLQRRPVLSEEDLDGTGRLRFLEAERESPEFTHWLILAKNFSQC